MIVTGAGFSRDIFKVGKELREMVNA